MVTSVLTVAHTKRYYSTRQDEDLCKSGHKYNNNNMCQRGSHWVSNSVYVALF